MWTSQNFIFRAEKFRNQVPSGCGIGTKKRKKYYMLIAHEITRIKFDIFRCHNSIFFVYMSTNGVFIDLSIKKHTKNDMQYPKRYLCLL